MKRSIIKTYIRRLLLIILLVVGKTADAQVNILTRIPSTAAEPDGIATLIKVPATARFEGAPIAVYHPGGFKSTGIGDKDAGLVLHGFIEIQFNFPGNDDPNHQSGGVYDTRGPLSLRASADVLRFAMGLHPDHAGRFIDDLTSPVAPLTDNVGIIGYSNGGNTNICVAGVHGRILDTLAWILNWESPVGDGMPQAECGAKQEGNLRPLSLDLNPAYDPATGQWMLDSLRFDPLIDIPVLDDIATSVTGGLYFDIDGDGLVDEGQDYVPYPLVFEEGPDHRGYYSERLRNEAEREQLFPDPPPAHIASREATEEFWRWRNGEKWVQATVQEIPDIMFIVVGSEIDHVQRAPDHPHILLQYERFRAAGARFVRLNPDRAYVEMILGAPAPDAVDNPAFTTFDHITVRGAIEPGRFDEILGRDTIVPAAACELADRTYYDDLRPDLDSPITSVEDMASAPKNFTLSQNYPNPFNESTLIAFTLPRSAHVRMDVLNPTGRKIETLLDETIAEGSHRIAFEASNPPSGVYLYRLKSDSQIVTRIMLLIR